MSVRSEIVYTRTYSRPLDNGGRETWEQTINRVCSHQLQLWEGAQGGTLFEYQLDELEELRALFLSKKALPAGRTLWLGGTELAQRRQSTQFNCSFLRVETVHDVVDAFWLLLQGCGVGFEPVPGTLSGFSTHKEVEIVRSTKGPSDRGKEKNTESIKDGVWTLKIGDSGEAWAKAIGKLLAGKNHAPKLVVDLREIRGAGGRMSQYGWISAGDEALAEGVRAICKILNRKVDAFLTWTDIIDLVNWLGFMQTGRRGAQIALHRFEEGWEKFANLKHGEYWKDNPQRAQSNNSLVFYERPSQGTILKILLEMYQAGGSEPGLINGQIASQRAPWFKGVNPCVTGDTPILTRNGHIPIKETVGEEVDIWDGKQFVTVVPFSTGINEVVTVNLSDGTSLNCTPYHKFVMADGSKVMADDLRPGDKLAKFSMPEIDAGVQIENAYSQGFYSGDGCDNYDFSYLYDTKFMCQKRLSGSFDSQYRNRKKWKHGPMLAKTYVPFKGDLNSRLNWLAGLFDADGTVCDYDNGSSIQLGSINKDFLLNVRLMLTTLGVQAKVMDAHLEGMRSMPDGWGGSKDYYCQNGYRLLINCVDVCRLIDLGLNCERLQFKTDPQRDARRFVKVVSVIDYGVEETFCFNNPINGTGTFNGIVTAQCSEILLGNKSFCNLMEVDISRFDNMHDLERALWLIGRANYRQTCVDLRDEVLQSAWHENNDFLRLCGVGLTGIVRALDRYTPYDFRKMRIAATEGARSMAREMGLPMPKLVTTIKPSGTVSKVMDTTEGIHKPMGRYIFNNIVFNKHDPLIPVLVEAGYEVIDHPIESSARIVKFPVQWPDVDFSDYGDGRYVNDDSALEQLERYKLLMDNYVDHNCSITVSYSPGEIHDIAEWIYNNWEHYVGVSFILRADPLKTAKDLGYAYLPQEVVAEKDWKTYVKGLKNVILDTIYNPAPVDAGDCATGVCPVR